MLWLISQVLADTGTVVLPLDMLPEPAEQPQEQVPVQWTLSWARTTVEPRGEVARVVQELRITPLRKGWVRLRVLDGRVRLTRAPAVYQGDDGHWWWIGEIDKPVTLRLEGTIALVGSSVDLAVAPAVRQEVRTVGVGLDFEVPGRVGESLPPTADISVDWRPHQDEPVNVEPVVQAQVATAVWLDEGEFKARSRVTLAVRRGEVERFVLALPAVTDLDVEGVEWSREGNNVVLTPSGPVDGQLVVWVSWRLPIQGGAASVQAPEPVGASSTTYTLTLAGSSETLISPVARGGLRQGALSALPAEERSIGDAPPVAAWTGRGTLELRVLQLAVLDGPPLVVDMASCTEALAPTGRRMVRCSLDVRNASLQFLPVAAPGMELMVARVNGDGVSAVKLDDGSWGVPLERSVETLEGLTTLDVDLVFMGQTSAFERRGEQSLALLSFGAPVANLRWEVRLPPGFSGEREGGTARVEGVPTAEIVYASTSSETAREAWNKALQAYQDNDFAAAQQYVDETLALNPNFDNALKLQSNLDVLSGQDAGDDAMNRRVKDMARAKVADQEVAQANAYAEAEEAMQRGDYDKAAEAYERVAASSASMQAYEQSESGEQRYLNEDSKKKASMARSRASANQDWASGSASASMDAPVEIAFAEEEIEGDYSARIVGDEVLLEAMTTTGDGGYVEGEELLLSLGYFEDGSGVYVVDGVEGGVAGGVVAGAVYGAVGAAEGEGTYYGAPGMVATGDGGNWESPVPEEPAPVAYVEPVEIDFQSASQEVVVVEGRAGAMGGRVGAKKEAAVAPAAAPMPAPVVNASPPPPPPPPAPPADASSTRMTAPKPAKMDDADEDMPYEAVDRESSDEAEVLDEEYLAKVPSGRSYQEAATPQKGAAGPSPARKNAEPEKSKAKDEYKPSPKAAPRRPDLAATTLAIPLPDHGQSIVVGQQLLAVGETPTLTLKYKEERK